MGSSCYLHQTVESCTRLFEMSDAAAKGAKPATKVAKKGKKGAGQSRSSSSSPSSSSSSSSTVQQARRLNLRFHLRPRKRREIRRENPMVYIITYLHVFNVLKIHPKGIDISNKALNIVSAFTSDVFDRITFEANRLSQLTKTKALITSNDIRRAVRIILTSQAISKSLGVHPSRSKSKQIFV